MTTRGHVELLLTATAVWLGFWAAGLPDYYQQYATRSLVVFEVLLLAPAIVYGRVRKDRRGYEAPAQQSGSRYRSAEVRGVALDG